MSHYRMERGWQGHPVFDDEPVYTKRDAWVWLIERAAWKPTKHLIGGKAVTIARGQLAATLRQMGEAWGWGHERVRRFLRLIAHDGMIETANETGKTIITICNYNTYQGPTGNGETGSEPRTRQKRDKNETLKKEGKEVEEGKKEETPNGVSPSAPHGAGVIDLEFEVFWREVPRKIGKGLAHRAYRTARKKAEAESLLAAIKRYAELRRGQEERFTKHPATWLNGECWLDETPPAEPKRWTIGIG